MSLKLLVVEDSVRDRDAVLQAASGLGWSCLVATSVEQAKELSAGAAVDVVYLDRQLDDSVDGLEYISWLNSLELERPGILVASVIDQSKDHVRALDLGADDYINKPFEPEEIRARLKAVARRLQSSRAPDSVVFIANMEVRMSSGVALIDDERINLSPKNRRLILALAACRGEWLRRDILWQKGWPEIRLPPQKDPINTSISRLRKQLLSLGGPTIEHSELGYRLAAQSSGSRK